MSSVRVNPPAVSSCGRFHHGHTPSQIRKTPARSITSNCDAHAGSSEDEVSAELFNPHTIRVLGLAINEGPGIFVDAIDYARVIEAIFLADNTSTG